MQRMHHRRIVWGLALALAVGTAAGQELGDIAGKAKLSDAERAKRDADKVYQWIRFHADKAAAAKSAKPAAAAPAPVAKAAVTANPAASPAAKPRAEAPTPAAVQPAVAAAAAVAAVADLPAPSVAAAASSQVLPELLASAAPSSSAVLPSPAARAAQAPLPVPAPEPEEEQPLTLLQRVEPEFPRQLLREGGNGSVLVRFTVKPDGSVSGAESLKASSPRLVRSVLDAVARWRFAPIREARSATVEVGFRSE